jgi:hypothetical protein
MEKSNHVFMWTKVLTDLFIRLTLMVTAFDTRYHFKLIFTP